LVRRQSSPLPFRPTTPDGSEGRFTPRIDRGAHLPANHPSRRFGKRRPDGIRFRGRALSGPVFCLGPRRSSRPALVPVL